MTKRHTPEYWREVAQKIQAITPRRVLHVKDIGAALGIIGTQSIMNAINKMIELNIMYAEQNGKRKEYYLND